LYRGKRPQALEGGTLDSALLLLLFGLTGFCRPLTTCSELVTSTLHETPPDIYTQCIRKEIKIDNYRNYNKKK
jgi:hypothetical protein